MMKDTNSLDKSRLTDLDKDVENILHDPHDREQDRQALEDFPETPLSDDEANFDDDAQPVALDEQSPEITEHDMFKDDQQDREQTFDVTNAKTLSRDPRKKDALSTYLTSTKQFAMLQPDEEIQLAKSWQEHGDEKAKERIIGAHLRLVAKIAQGYRGYSMPLLDLISEGHIGMMRALEKFDPQHGTRFSTYAMWWIKASMQDYVMRNWSLVKTGTTAAQKKLFFNLRTMRRKMLNEGQKYLTKEQIKHIATDMNVPEKTVADMARRMNGNDYSLNTPIGGDHDGVWMDWLEDDSDNQEVKVLQNDEFQKRSALLEKAFKHLKPRELHIMQMRRLAEPPKTLEEIGLELNLSRERVRQIEVKAFTKLQKRVKENVRTDSYAL